jgi:hypothetical protein
LINQHPEYRMLKGQNKNYDWIVLDQVIHYASWFRETRSALKNIIGFWFSFDKIFFLNDLLPKQVSYQCKVSTYCSIPINVFLITPTHQKYNVPNDKRWLFNPSHPHATAEKPILMQIKKYFLVTKKKS